jgi:hypothetical protein
MIRRFSSTLPSHRANDPISISEFAHELSKIWHPQKAPEKFSPRAKIGTYYSSAPNQILMIIYQVFVSAEAQIPWL